MRFHVVGTGSIGTLIGYHLRRVLPPQHPITFITRSPRKAHKLKSQHGAVSVEHAGVTMSIGGFEYESQPRRPIVWPRPRRDGAVWQTPPRDRITGRLMLDHKIKPPFQCLILACKANATLEVARRLQPRITRRTTVVLLQNGMGMYETLIEKLWPNPIRRPQFILTTNTHGAFMRDTSAVVHTGNGSLEFGIIPDPCQKRNFEESFSKGPNRPEDRKGSLLDISHPPKDPHGMFYLSLRNTLSALSTIELNTRWRPIADIGIAMRRKVVANAAINPLTALLNCTNGEILHHPEGPQLIREVCAEAEAVFRAQLRQEAIEYEQASTNMSRLDEGSPDTASAHMSEGAQLGQVAAEFDQSDQQLIIEGEPEADDPTAEDAEDHVMPASPSPFSPIDHPQLPAALCQEALYDECCSIARRTSRNISSMLADVRAGRTTEIDYMNGYISALGKKYGVQTPTTDMLQHMIKLRTSIPLRNSD